MRLDTETGIASSRSATAEQRAAFEQRWPEVLRARFGWDEARGPTAGNATLLVLESDEGAYAGHLWLSEQEDLFTGETTLWITTVAVLSLIHI